LRRGRWLLLMWLLSVSSSRLFGSLLDEDGRSGGCACIEDEVARCVVRMLLL
jgi:hypothetical protein